MNEIKTLDGDIIEVASLDEVKLAHKSVNMVSVKWLVIWALLFWPVALVMWVATKDRLKYSCLVSSHGQKQMYVFDEDNYTNLKLLTNSELQTCQPNQQVKQ